MEPAMHPSAALNDVALDGQPTYTVSTWDHEIERWEPRERSATKWELRRWLRQLCAEGWDHVSILVERNS
jgi:hypothetical protein